MKEVLAAPGIKYKVIPVYLPWTETTRYKLRIRKKFLGIPYWIWLYSWNDSIEEFKIHFFDSEEDVVKYIENTTEKL